MIMRSEEKVACHENIACEKEELLLAQMGSSKILLPDSGIQGIEIRLHPLESRI